MNEIIKEKTELLNNKFSDVVIFDKKRHKYYINGEEYISVTTLLSDYFDNFDAEKIAEKKEKEALEKGDTTKTKEYWINLWKKQQKRGSRYHKELENYFKNGKEPKTKLVKSVILTLEREFAKQFGNNYKLFSELIVYNKYYKIAGCIDLLLLDENGMFHIFDFKFVNKIKYSLEKYNAQLNLYKTLLNLNNIDVEAMVLVNVSEINKKHYNIGFIYLDEDSVMSQVALFERGVHLYG